MKPVFICRYCGFETTSHTAKKQHWETPCEERLVEIEFQGRRLMATPSVAAALALATKNSHLSAIGALDQLEAKP